MIVCGYPIFCSHISDVKTVFEFIVNINICVSFSTATSAPIPPAAPNDTVSFLGMRLSAEDAEAGLTATFALLVAAALGVVCTSFLLVKAKKHSKEYFYMESITMEQKL